MVPGQKLDHVRGQVQGSQNWNNGFCAGSGKPVLDPRDKVDEFLNIGGPGGGFGLQHKQMDTLAGARELFRFIDMAFMIW
jgi:hypothetical protein